MEILRKPQLYNLTSVVEDVEKIQGFSFDPIDDYSDDDDDVKPKKDKNKNKKKNKDKKDKIKTNKKVNEKSAEKTKKTKKSQVINIDKVRKEAERIRMEKEAEKKQAEVDVIHLIARRDMLRAKLNQLDNTKKKDIIKIASINIELNNIDEALNELRTEYDIHRDEIDTGSKFKRAINFVKKKVTSFFGKVKKFFKKNAEPIVGFASIIFPFVGSLVAKKIVKNDK